MKESTKFRHPCEKKNTHYVGIGWRATRQTPHNSSVLLKTGSLKPAGAGRGPPVRTPIAGAWSHAPLRNRDKPHFFRTSRNQPRDRGGSGSRGFRRMRRYNLWYIADFPSYATEADRRFPEPLASAVSPVAAGALWRVFVEKVSPRVRRGVELVNSGISRRAGKRPIRRRDAVRQTAPGAGRRDPARPAGARGSGRPARKAPAPREAARARRAARNPPAGICAGPFP